MRAANVFGNARKSRRKSKNNKAKAVLAGIVEANAARDDQVRLNGTFEQITMTFSAQRSDSSSSNSICIQSAHDIFTSLLNIASSVLNRGRPA
jgi:hypothetical protein